MNIFVVTFAGVLALAGKVPPAAEDVKAGWGAFAIFVGLTIAVGLLGWSLTRHLKKAKLNADAGAFGDEDRPS